jgi:hypothetical protein
MSSCVQRQRLRTGMSLLATTDKYTMTLGSAPMPLAGMVPHGISRDMIITGYAAYREGRFVGVEAKFPPSSRLTQGDG